MPNQRACIPCKYPAAEEYLDRRLGEGADLRSIRQELSTPYRMKAIGYGKGPSLQSLQTHQRDHRSSATVPVSTNLPTFSGSEGSPSSPLPAAEDVATTIQREALAALERGEMRITAQHALKAQEMLDRRAEKAADRELVMVLTRLAVSQGKPPPSLIKDEVVIEGEVKEVGTAD